MRQEDVGGKDNDEIADMAVDTIVDQCDKYHQKLVDFSSHINRLKFGADLTASRTTYDELGH